MNWRFAVGLILAFIIRAVVVAKLGWTYRPFRDPFSLAEFGRDATLFVFILGVCLAVVAAVFPKTDD